MSRYIDADKIEYRRNCAGCSGLLCDSCEDYIAEMDQIDAIPTADVVEVKHGHWIVVRQRAFACGDPVGEMVISHYLCSECGRKEYNREEYCHCGAKMDGKDGRKE